MHFLPVTKQAPGGKGLRNWVCKVPLKKVPVLKLMTLANAALGKTRTKRVSIIRRPRLMLMLILLQDGWPPSNLGANSEDSSRLRLAVLSLFLRKILPPSVQMN